uniref:HD-ZIP protein N-terminal domain-containing protein n=1 Tax=Gossypium raimondii TaxID=29730 RepID=A0A0D2SD04_GOSRA|nr:hypothetical protein B456_007G029200 [Gossypium raimondii]
MMVGKDQDLGLSLSLSSSQNHHLLQLNLSPSLVPSSANQCYSPSDPNTESLRAETRSFLKGIDVNRLPSTVDCEEEAGVSSPNSTISSSLSGKRSEREGNNNGDELEIERASSHGISDEEDGDTSRKKLRLSKDQSAILEECFKEHNTLNPVSNLNIRAKPSEKLLFGCREFFLNNGYNLFCRSKSWLWLNNWGYDQDKLKFGSKTEGLGLSLSKQRLTVSF